MRFPLPVRAHAGTLAVLVALTAVACLLVAGLPRATQASFDEALRRALTTAPAVQTDLTVASEPVEDLRERAQFESLYRHWQHSVPAALRPLITPDGHMSAKTSRTPVTGTGGGTYINLGWLSDADRRVDWVQGRMPGPTSTTRHEGETIPLIEVGVVDEAVREMGLGVGQIKMLGESDYVAVKIVGIFKAKNPGDRYWSHDLDILHVSKQRPPGGMDEELHLTTLMSDAGLTALSGAARHLTYRWVLPLDGRAASALDVPDLDAAVAELGRLVKVQEVSNNPHRLDTGLPKLLDDFSAALAAAQTVLYLALGGLLTVALGVIVLGVRLLTDRMEHTFALARARGGSLRQVAGAGAAMTALAVAPAALAGYALSFLVPGPVLAVVHVGPAVVVVTAVAFAAVRVSVAHRTPLHERRDDVADARPSVRRVTLEVLVVGLALVGAYLLRARGLSQDPLLLFVPVALTLAAALITLRCYPYPLRLLVRLAARGRAAVPFLGLTRAARARSASGLPVLVLLPALAVSVFATMISNEIASTQVRASWQQVGAPIKVTSVGEIPASVIEKVRATDGVEQVVMAQTGQVQLADAPEYAAAIAVDVAQWRRLIAGTPISVPPLSGGTSALVSPALKGRGAFEIGWLSRPRVTPQGVIDSVPGFWSSGKFLVMPMTVLPRPQANTLLIKGDVSRAELARLVPAATVDSQKRALAAIREDPLTGIVRSTLVVVTVALGLYALVAVVLSLLVGAAERARAVSFLRTLGLSDRQARRLTVLEVLPMVLVTALVGLGLGLGLPIALGPGVDLSAYAGDLQVSGYSPDLVMAGVLAGGLAVAAALGAYAHTALGRHRDLGAVLRVGDQS
ncbi:FtsX-like permease family protein [Nonomuraea turkmeniaca]|uniref:FtsX-like permease family protein n=1 Tax=Nonomuraea turkmeniaca TaxID=103838 RepID=A0A5S4FHM5_9ACTN|nr:FtsX-like permease family protein [Nonomuraea turkmeniaca]TMR18554.1 FtsX-like permease family protein [Nonomuraea turkmeniaca]